MIKRTILLTSIAVILLLIAISPDNSYGYYTFIKFIITPIAGYFAYLLLSNEEDDFFGWAMAAVALAFNPIFPLRLDRSLWVLVDVVVIILFIVFTFFVIKDERRTRKIERAYEKKKTAHLDISEFEAEVLLAQKIIKRKNIASTAVLQREMHIGYGKAAEIIEWLEMKGMVSKADASEPRKILF